jgi:hypothetical protein
LKAESDSTKSINGETAILKRQLIKSEPTNAHLLTYLLTPWSRVLLEKLTVNFATSQEIPRIYGT